MSFRWIALVGLVYLGGCASLADYHYYRVNKSRAKSAWKDAKKCLPDERCCHDFGKGYQAGYLDVSRGGDGTAPPVPPSCYWGPSFQTPEGRCLIGKWYDGFAQGAADALRCSRDSWHDIPTRTCGIACGNCGEQACTYENIQRLESFGPMAQHPSPAATSVAPASTNAVPMPTSVDQLERAKRQ